MQTFSYRKSTVTTLKACGFLDTDHGVIDIEGVDKDILSLLSDFNGAFVDLVVKVKDEYELDEPSPTE